MANVYTRLATVSHRKITGFGLRQRFGTMPPLKRLFVGLLAFVVISIYFLWPFPSDKVLSYVSGDTRPFVLPDLDMIGINQTASAYTDDPIEPPYMDQFWEAGQRLRNVTQWLSALDQLNSRAPARHELSVSVERVIANLVPLSKNSTEMPFQDLRSSFQQGSRGIVIPAGGDADAIRFASHLIICLRVVLGCRLPIQIAYAGDDDLPKTDRDLIAGLDAATDVTFLNVLPLFDDSRLKLREGGWAIKPFAALASHFEQVILVDADAVFLQEPSVLFNQSAFQDHGASLYHDRLLWQHSFQARHKWFEDQIVEPSPAMQESLVWTEDYAEECDSGVVVLDKSRVEVLMGLVHTSWQNTQGVRDEVTYKLMHGDKESWWLGLELAGSGYAFEAHYGSIVGWESSTCDTEDDSDCVCSFTIAHIDDDGDLLWFNGSLLKNKRTDATEYVVPEAWMTNGQWRKGATKDDMSCMTGATAKHLTKLETNALAASIDAAKKVDRHLNGKSTEPQARAAGQTSEAGVLDWLHF